MEFVSRHLNQRYGSPSTLSTRRIRLPFGTLGDDGGCYEIRTRPAPGSHAAGILMECLEYMHSVSAKTRAEDGLHINVSLERKPLHSLVNPIWVWMLADPRRWALKFGRSRCWACRLPPSVLPAEILDFLASSSSVSRPAINFSHFRPSSAPVRSRIEFRYPGGKNYHRRPRLLLSCLDSILTAVAGSIAQPVRPRKIGLPTVSLRRSHEQGIPSQ